MDSPDVCRCGWCNLKNQAYIDYHDREWGVPSHDDHRLFELLILESFQAGLSWECVLNKRESFRRAFDRFDLSRVCGYEEADVQRLLSDSSIIRNQLKIRASITNARVFRSIQLEYGSFSNYIWHFTEGRVLHETGKASSTLSDRISADLRKRGMKFVGTTIVYSYLQAMGVINSHDEGCFLYQSDGL
ncbi:DNA-3-methyladenine glycosylase I [Oscillibacter sp. MSJ-2]|uniref:DNA-3-methyladenine glycosylase I n=1 Tax=Dysosmobacter acutus TaxID=2841504 RepID=A0ABS6F4X1_9FIRM|nr:DNA-3-methyladenine glycosylase I [Dysosmobacter acutus]MBU5625337.1 DNA-3-methyladenine glycosylase I [Dysosmobacter acutus]